MSDEFITLTDSLNVPLPSAADIAALRALQAQWEHWHDREHAHAQAVIAGEQARAFEAFVEDPTPENERRLLLTADETLTGRRYARMRQACEALRRRISAEAAEVLRPVIDRLHAALAGEHERRFASAEPVRSNKRNNPVVIESQKAVEFCERMSNQVLWASGAQGNGRSPLELAGVLVALSEAEKLTPEEGR